MIPDSSGGAHPYQTITQSLPHGSLTSGRINYLLFVFFLVAKNIFADISQAQGVMQYGWGKGEKRD